MADLKVSELPVISIATDDDLLIINDGNITTSTLTWDNLKASIDELTGQIDFVSGGTELAPTIIFGSDVNTGLYSPGEDQLALVTNGDTAIYIDSAGRVGIGNEVPGSFDSLANDVVLGDINGADYGITIAAGDAYTSSIYFADGTAAGARDAGQVTYNHNIDDLAFHTAATEKVRITSEGYLGIGTTNPADLIHISAGDSGVTTPVSGVQGVIVEANGSSNAGVQFHTDATSTAGVYFGDPDNADASHVVYDHSIDMLGIGVGGSEQLKINSFGFVGLNTDPVIGNMVTLGGMAAGLPSFSGYVAQPLVTSSVTDNYTNYLSDTETQDADFTLSNLFHYRAIQSDIGATSSVTRQYGYYADASITGADTNYGFYSALTGSDNYAFYAANNAKVYMNTTEFKVANGGTDIMTIGGSMVSVSHGIVVGGGDTASRPGTQTGLIRFNTDESLWEGWTGTEWVLLGDGARVHVGLTPPLNASSGDLWWHSAEGEMYVRYADGDSLQWVSTTARIGDITMPDLGDVTLTNAQVWDRLHWTGTQWVNFAFTTDASLTGVGRPADPLIVDHEVVKTRMNLATVATTNSYNDLDDKPTIPTATPGTPVGTVIHVLMQTAPTGYLAADGSAISRTTYADLFAAIGETFGAGDGSTTFNLPDLRGEFVRGWDNGRGIDNGRAFGSGQSQEFQSHNHTLADPTHTHGASGDLQKLVDSSNNPIHTAPPLHNPIYVGTVNNTDDGMNNSNLSGLGIFNNLTVSGYLGNGGGSSPAATGVTIGANGGAETRPRNIALLACVKY